MSQTTNRVDTNRTMSSSEEHSPDLYPNATRVIQQITKITKRRKCIFRGESKLYDYPCSSGFYRELKDEGVTDGDMPVRLKKEQEKLIVKLRNNDKWGEWETDLERLMDHQHKRETTNLLDFTGDLLVALFFACSQDKNSDGQVIVKRKSVFRELNRSATLPDDVTVLLQPPELLLRARDQRAVLIHTPKGVLSFDPDEAVLIKDELKEEILELLKNNHDISRCKIYRIGNSVVQELYKEERQTAPTFQLPTRLHGLAMPDDDEDIPTMERYTRLLANPVRGLYKKRLIYHAEALIERLTNTIKFVSHDAKAHYNRAFIHQTKPNPDYEQAISDYTRAIELNPDYIEAYNNRGVAYSVHNHKKAISDYDRAIELNPDYIEAYNNRGNSYARTSPPDYIKALLDYSQALELNPDNTVAYNNRGVVYSEKPNPDYKKAISDFNCALKLTPDYTMAYYNRALVYQSKPKSNYIRSKLDYARALKDNSLALKLNPNLAMAYNNRGIVYAKKKDYDQAISDFTRALELNHKSELAYNNLGNAYLNKPAPNYKKALRNYRRALELNPNYADVYSNRGNLYLSKRGPDYKKAIRNYTRATELNPSHVDAYFKRGLSYMKKPNRDYDQAILDFTRVVELDPGHAVAYGHRAKARARTVMAHARTKQLKEIIAMISDACNFWKWLPIRVFKRCLIH